MPECTKCGTDLEFDDTIDTYIDADIVIFYEVGHCSKCGKSINGEMCIISHILKI